MMGETMAKRKDRTPDAVLGPPTIRLRRGDVQLSRETIKDDNGEISQPYRTRGALVRLHEAGSIDGKMLAAGERFHRDFIVAGMEPLKAADLGAALGGAASPGLPFHLVSARDDLWAALQALGGISSPSGCCAWHVLGREATLKSWAMREGWRGRPLHVHTASGILIGALGILTAEYGLTSGGRLE